MSAELNDEDLPDQSGGEFDEREAKELARRAFGRRISELMAMTGLSQREFGARHHIHYSRISYYKGGRDVPRMPPLEFLDPLVREARWAGLSADEAMGVYRFYGETLVQVATPDGSDQNSLLLRVFQQTVILQEKEKVLEEVCRERDELLVALERVLQQGSESDVDTVPGKEVAEVEVVETTSVHVLQREYEELKRQHVELVGQRTELLAELRALRARYFDLVESEGADEDAGAQEGRKSGAAKTVRWLSLRKSVVLGAVALLAAGVTVTVFYGGLPSGLTGHDKQPKSSTSESPRHTSVPDGPSESSERKPKESQTSRGGQPASRPLPEGADSSVTGGGDGSATGGNGFGEVIGGPSETPSDDAEGALGDDAEGALGGYAEGVPDGDTGGAPGGNEAIFGGPSAG